MPDTPTAFAELGLDPRIVATLSYSVPSPIQREAVPVLLQGKDFVGLAGTGTGKTAAFALPLIHRLAADTTPRTGVAAIVLTPTRELAMQVARSVAAYGKPVGIRVLAVYGGTGYGEQIRMIRKGVDVVVATPGRALDLIRSGRLPLTGVKVVVLDEADEMLDMGFADDIDAILAETPAERQTMLFSATMPPRIEEIAQRHLREPVRVQVARALPTDGEPARVRQTAYRVPREHKLAALGRILDVERPSSAIVFCRTRSEADELTEMLHQRSFKPLALHGGLSQEQRDRVMSQFRAGAADLLVATDIAARGLDITHLSHVINYDVPPQPDAYVHRVGRVGRAGREGVAITLVTPKELSALKAIEREAKATIPFAPVPTAADLRASRLERAANRMKEAIAVADDTGRPLLDELLKEHSAEAVALAAIKLLTVPGRAEDEEDIPTGRDPHMMRPERLDRSGRPRPEGPRPRPAPRKGMSKVFLSVGREANVTPRDLVGAIANEAGVPGRDIGAIDLMDRFATVEVPTEVAEYVVQSMQGTRIKGRKVNASIDRNAERPKPR